MGFTPNSSPKGGPTFNNSPQTTADLNEARRFTEERGNDMVGTHSDRTDVTGASLYDGLTFYETDTDYTYRYKPGGWRLAAAPSIGCRAIKTTGGGSAGGLTGAGAFAFATITFDTDDADPLDMHTTAAPSRITVPVAGWYGVHASFFGAAASTGFGIRLLKNGAPIEGLQSWDSGLGSSGLASPQLSDILKLSAGDYLEVQAASQQTTAQSIVTTSGFRPVFSTVLVQTA